jgi:hypothetical protein
LLQIRARSFRSDSNELSCHNRPYSKVNKSTRTKVAVIFDHFRFSVINYIFFVVVIVKFEFVSKTSSLFICCNAITQKV